ncbi:MAG TPA: hypothetical protein PKA55_14040 [Rhodoblastus sp.]|nr:hypothetical protein [Rhodoblastus sp.]
MHRRFHVLAGAAGALICGLAAAGWRLAGPPPFAASALVAVAPDVAIPAAYDLAALRALATNDAVLRQAALAPEAAAAIAREARPEPFDALLGLLSSRASQTDTLSRAADLLAARLTVEAGDGPRSLRVKLRMEEAVSAAQAANAVAQAIVAAHNAASAKLDRRLDQTRRDRIACAERRREAARDRLASLRAIDMTPTASIAAGTPPDAAAQALSEARRAATDAETRRAGAARIYGPRHPEMIRLETQARRAAAALQAARARAAAAPPAPSRPVAEGGPDPRIAELAAAQADVDRAEAAYDREAAQAGAPNREARLTEAARPPDASDRASTPLTVAAAAVLGFLAFGAAPGLGGQASRTGRARPDRPHAVLRRGNLDPADARQIVEAMDIAASAGARRILVTGESRRLKQDGAHALAIAAAQAGWRPLLIDTSTQATERAQAAVRFDGRTFATSTTGALAEALVVARPAPAPRAPAVDVDRAFDLALFDETGRIDRADVAIWVGAAPPSGRSPVQSTQTILWIAPA